MRFPTPTLLCLLACAAVSRPAAGAPETTVSFDTGSKVVFSDAAKLHRLGGGSTADGNGCVVQIGYYDGATTGGNFTGNWVPLTGEAGANSAFANTSVGDATANGAGSGTMAVSLTFVQGSATAGNSLPPAGTPLAVRFYNATTIAFSTNFNAVSCDEWLWQSPQTPPGSPTLNLSLNAANLEWLGGGGTAFYTSEPTGNTPPDGPFNGGYAGLVRGSDAADFAHTGSISIALHSDTLAFSAKLVFGGKKYALRGTADAAGHWTGTATLAKSPTLLVAFDAVKNDLSGTVTTTDAVPVVSQIAGGHVSTGTKLSPDPLAGVYTLLFVPENQNAGSPGTGWATLKVDGLGTAKMTGAMPDGAKFSASGKLLATGVLLLNAPLYSSKGGVIGTLLFRDTQSVSDADGDCHWHRPVGASVAALDADMSVIASKYVPLPHALAADFSPAALAAGNLAVTFTSGAGAVSKPASLGATNKMAAIDPAGNFLAVSLTAASGAFHGTFQRSAASAKLPFSGVIFPKQQSGAGFFLEDGISGSAGVSLNP